MAVETEGGAYLSNAGNVSNGHIVTLFGDLVVVVVVVVVDYAALLIMVYWGVMRNRHNQRLH